jgi:hypothetical protein
MALTKVKLIADGVVDVDHLAANHGITTDNIGEGSALYYTDARVSSYLTTNSYATEGFVTTAVSNLVASAPSTLDTLNELAAALGDDPNFATTVTNSIAGKLPLTGGTLTGTLVLNRGGFETFNGTNTDYRLTINQNSGPYPRIYNYDNTGATGFHSIVIGGENNDTSGILIGEGNNPDTTVFGNLAITSSASVRFNGAGDNTHAVGYDSVIDGSFLRGQLGVRFLTGTGGGSERARIDSSGINVSGTIKSNANEGKLVLNSTAANGKQYEFISIDTGNLGLYDGTAYRLWVGGNGNIGIGTTSPSNKLHVVDTNPQIRVSYSSPTDSRYAELSWFGLIGNASDTAGNSFNIGMRGGSSSEGKLNFQTGPSTDYQTRMTIDRSGNVGIGTTLPSQKLEVNGNVYANKYLLPDGGDLAWNGGYSSGNPVLAANGDEFRLYAAGNGTTNILYLSNSRLAYGGNVGIGTTSPDQVLHIKATNAPTLKIESGDTSGASGEVIGKVDFWGNDFSGTGRDSRGYIASVYEDAFARAALTFGTGDYNATSSERMRIDSSGNVGIGVTAPGMPLHVKGYDAYSSFGNNVIVIEDSIGDYSGILMSGSSGRNAAIRTEGGNDITFWTNLDRNTNWYRAMTILSGGNVGIGTASPSAKLHTNLALQGSLLSYLNGTSTTFDGGANLLAVHNSPSIGSATAAGLTLANNDKSINAISPVIAFSAKSDSNTYNHTYAAIYGVRTGAGADSNWVVGDIVFATNYNTGPLERVRIKGGTGNVGINHTNPDHKLHILNSSVGSNFSKVIKLSCDPSVGGGNAIFFKTSGNDTENRYGVKVGAVRSVNDNGSSEFIIQMESANMAGMENVFRINRDKRVIIGEATGYDGDLASRNGWVLNYTGGGGTTCNFSGSNEIFTFNQRDGQGTTQIDFRNGNVERGRIEWTTSATTYNTTSDYRLKENIIDLGDCISKVQELKPKQFNFISDPQEPRIGFIAHEVEDIVPQAVSGEKDAVREDGTPKYQALDHSMLVPLLVGAIKELKAEIDLLKAQLNG